MRRQRYFKNQLHPQTALIPEMSCARTKQKQQSFPGHSQLQFKARFNYVKMSTQTEQRDQVCFYFNTLSCDRKAQDPRAEVLPGAVEGLFSHSLHSFHDVVLVLGAGGSMAAHLGQEHLCRNSRAAT